MIQDLGLQKTWKKMDTSFYIVVQSFSTAVFVQCNCLLAVLGGDKLWNTLLQDLADVASLGLLKISS